VRPEQSPSPVQSFVQVPARLLEAGQYIPAAQSSLEEQEAPRAAPPPADFSSAEQAERDARVTRDTQRERRSTLGSIRPTEGVKRFAIHATLARHDLIRIEKGDPVLPNFFRPRSYSLEWWAIQDSNLKPTD
jgi:hypothetical protein